MLRCDISSGAPDGFNFFGRDVHSKAPSANVWAFNRQHWVERHVRRGERTSEAIQLLRCSKLIHIEQVTKPANDRAHA